MKAYTDLEQSKKLAGILPIESADMSYSTWTILESGEFIVSPNQGNTIENLRKDYGNQIIPCWSLAALLDQLEDVICDEDGNQWELVIKKEGVQYDLYYLIVYGDQENIELDRFYDDLIDCCVEMILKLHEQKLL